MTRRCDEDLRCGQRVSERIMLSVGWQPKRSCEIVKRKMRRYATVALAEPEAPDQGTVGDRPAQADALGSQRPAEERALDFGDVCDEHPSGHRFEQRGDRVV